MFAKSMVSSDADDITEFLDDSIKSKNFLIFILCCFVQCLAPCRLNILRDFIESELNFFLI